MRGSIARWPGLWSGRSPPFEEARRRPPGAWLAVFLLCFLLGLNFHPGPEQTGPSHCSRTRAWLPLPSANCRQSWDSLSEVCLPALVYFSLFVCAFELIFSLRFFFSFTFPPQALRFPALLLVYISGLYFRRCFYIALGEVAGGTFRMFFCFCPSSDAAILGMRSS